MNACTHWIHAQVRVLALSVILLALTGCSARDSLLLLSPTMLPTLSGLTLSAGTLNPSFAAHVTRYTTMAIDTPSITVTPTAGPGATITVNGTPVASGTASGAITLQAGHRVVTVAVTSNSGTATYTITAHRLAQESYIKASNTGAGDLFGFSVALDGDTLAVGAIGEASNGRGVNSGAEADNSARASGAVYVFTRHGGTWHQQAYIKASNTKIISHSEDGAAFGSRVALSGNTLAVAAPFESSSVRGVNSGTGADNDAPASGAVYVFTRHNGTWHQQAYIKASNTDQGDFFSQSVALDGETLAVGAFEESSSGRGINSAAEADNSAFGSGAVYVFTRHNGTWHQQAYIKASNAEANDLFGFSVALDANTLAVGATGESSNGRGVNSGAEADNSAPGSGAVYVFTRHGGTWHQQAYIKASNAESSNAFGISVALSNHTLAVGAVQDTSGAVYILTQNGGAWYEQTFVKASNADKGDSFGISVALYGNTLAVGATGESSNGRGVNSGAEADNSARNAGAVYVGCVVRVHSQHHPTTHLSEERCSR
ncbi:MAG: hypothetical protein OJF51_002986 [Nitrospira sp.]|jgi:hypothetical protein|nr:MAG: hypothetical protein OJF51_002986 [Nitrospira sp.]